RLIGRIVDEDLGHLTKGPRVVAARVRVAEAELLDEFSGLRELEDEAVCGAVPTYPHHPFAVNRDAVIRLRPLIILARPAPGRDQIAGRVELEHRRRTFAAFAGRRIQFSPTLVVVQARRTAVDDPDVFSGVDRHADRIAEQPMIWKRLWPHRIDFESGCLYCTLRLSS